MRGRHSAGRPGPVAAAQDRLPPLVCGTAVTAAGLQEQIFGPSGNPW